MSPMQVLFGVIALIGAAAAAANRGHDGNAFDDAASVLDNFFAG